MTADILLVDDDNTMRRALASWLTLAGYRVTQAPDGEAAIDHLEQTHFAVVITDIVMGDIDGIEVLHTARCLTRRPAVILLTGHGSLESAVAAVRSGAHDYLLKPCDEEYLLNSVADAVQRYQSEQRLRDAAQILTDFLHVGAPNTGAAIATSPPANLRVGEISIGTSRKQVWIGSRQVQLTPIEYALLCYLAERPEQVHRYSAIVRSTHQLNLDEFEAKGLLRTHFLNLRKKLGSAYFATDRGIGYMLTIPRSEAELEASK
ncbi:response regulator transcription factor [Chloroflexia bacterium SDU3-3]|nr:response regulator transcription factor [Chloroflexia bacterium SDU3-3]